MKAITLDNQETNNLLSKTYNKSINADQSELSRKNEQLNEEIMTLKTV